MPTKKKIKIKVNELTDADCEYVSIVSRGANRVPFRMTKSEDGKVMINLSNISTLFKSEVKESTIAAVLVSGDMSADAARLYVEAAGLNADNVSEVEGVTVFNQKAEGEVTGDTIVIKFNEQIAVAIEHSNVAKAFESWNYEGTSFAELMAQEGVYPSLYTASEVLSSTINNVLRKADSPSDAVMKTQEAIDTYKSYVSTLLTAIPTTAFKLEDPELIAEVATKLEALKAEDDKSETSKSEDEATEEETVEKKDEDPDPKAVEKSEEEGAEKETATKTEDAKEEDETATALAGLAASVAAMHESLAGIGALQKSMETMSSRIEEVANVAKSAEEAVKGTVLASATDDHVIELKTHSAKAEPGEHLDSDGYLSLDTAMNRPR